VSVTDGKLTRLIFDSLVVEPSLEKKITCPGTLFAHVRITVGARVVKKSLLVITAIRINCFFCDTRGKLIDETNNASEFCSEDKSSVIHRLILQRKTRPD
jgi:hypothetical protein